MSKRYFLDGESLVIIDEGQIRIAHEILGSAGGGYILRRRWSYL